jgi:hypothetical protein
MDQKTEQCPGLCPKGTWPGRLPSVGEECQRGTEAMGRSGNYRIRLSSPGLWKCRPGQLPDSCPAFYRLLPARRLQDNIPNCAAASQFAPQSRSGMVWPSDAQVGHDWD